MTQAVRSSERLGQKGAGPLSLMWSHSHSCGPTTHVVPLKTPRAFTSRTSSSPSHIGNALDARVSNRFWGTAAVLQST